MNASIWSLRGIGWTLGIDAKRLEAVASSVGQYYQPFSKQEIGKKARHIDNPTGALKEIQQRIYHKLLKPLQFPNHLHGGLRGRSAESNARQHLAKKCVLHIDIADFFPSVRDSQIYQTWSSLGYGASPARLLTRLTTYEHRLPQGAATSTALANLVLLESDLVVLEPSCAQGVDFTRFVDDLNLSGDSPQLLIHETITALSDAGFRVSRKKLELMYSSGLQEVTGLGVNSPSGPSVPRYKRDKIRAGVHCLAAIKSDSEREKAKRILMGRIGYINRTNPGAARTLKRQMANVMAALSSKTSS